MTSHPMTDPASRMDPPPASPPQDRDDAPESFADRLLAYASKAADAADRLTPRQRASPMYGNAAEALGYMRAAREALQARQIADEPPSERERAAFEQLVRHQREKIATAGQALGDVIGQRDDLAAFLRRIAGEVDGLHTPGSDALAGRIRRHLADVLAADPAEEAADGAD